VPTERVVIIGAGGFGREVLDVIEAINAQPSPAPAVEIEALGFLDDGAPDLATLAPYGVPHLGPVEALNGLPDDVGYIIGIGSPSVRRQIDEQFRGQRMSPVVIHPSATIGRGVTLGPGSVVCAGVRMTNNIVCGRHTHLNINATVGHDARLANYVTVSPLVAISGYVALEDEVMVGTGVTINPGVRVGRESVLGSGAAVLKDVPPRVTAVGVPAKVR